MNTASVLLIVVAILAFAQGVFIERRRKARTILSVWTDAKTGELCVRYGDGHTERHKHA